MCEKYLRHRTTTVPAADLARHAMFAMSLLSAEEVKVKGIAVLGKPDGSLVEERGPLEGCTVKTLALSAMAVLSVDRITVVFEFDCITRKTGKMSEMGSLGWEEDLKTCWKLTLSAPALGPVLDFKLFALPAIRRLKHW